jgi:hypothetical protein
MGLTGGRPTVRLPGDGSRCAGERLSQAKREAKEGARRAVLSGGAPVAFIGRGRVLLNRAMVRNRQRH